MSPILGFVVGMLSCMVMQFGIWWSVQKGQSALDYWKQERGHMILLLGAGPMFCFLWADNGLDWVFAHLPLGVLGDWWKAGVPYTPQVGAIAGFTLAFRGVDMIVAAFKSRNGGADAPAAPVIPSGS
jgi:hypothetical protein